MLDLKNENDDTRKQRDELGRQLREKVAEMWVRREKWNVEKRELQRDLGVISRGVYKMMNGVHDTRKDRDEALRNLNAASMNLRKLQDESKEHNYILKSLVEKKGGLAMVAVTACNMNLEHL